LAESSADKIRNKKEDGMPVIKVWCLPKMTAVELNKLHKNIVTAVVSVKELGLSGEDDMTCVFPPSDMMYEGLGDKIIIEVTGLFKKPERTPMVQQQLAKVLSMTVFMMFPRALVECFVYPFNPIQKFYSIRPGSPSCLPLVETFET